MKTCRKCLRLWVQKRNLKEDFLTKTWNHSFKPWASLNKGDKLKLKSEKFSLETQQKNRIALSKSHTSLGKSLTKFVEKLSRILPKKLKKIIRKKAQKFSELSKNHKKSRQALQFFLRTPQKFRKKLIKVSTKACKKLKRQKILQTYNNIKFLYNNF